MTKVLIKQLICSLCLLILSKTSIAIQDTSNIEWGYLGNRGPDYWSQLDPSFILCAKGKKQSPINITSFITKRNELQIQYSPAPLHLVRNGITQLRTENQKIVIRDGRAIQLNFPDESVTENLIFNDVTYRLKELHIHTPSENQLQGRAFPMELHFVHQGNGGRIAILGVFVKTGNNNPALASIISNIPRANGKERHLKNLIIDPNLLIPMTSGFFSFEGSLTMPPCVENVQWIIMQEPITAASGQILQIRKAAGGVNARPVQSLHGRTVFFTQMTESKLKMEQKNDKLGKDFVTPNDNPAINLKNPT